MQRNLRGAKSPALFLNALLDQGVPETELVAAMASLLGMPGAALSRTTVDLDVLDSVPRVVAETDLVLPLSTEGGRLHVAVSAAADDYQVIDELRFITGLEVSSYVALPGPLQNSIAAAYDARERGERFWRGDALQGEVQAGVAVIAPDSGHLTLSGPTTDEVLDATAEMALPELDVEVGSEDDAGEEVIGSVGVRAGPATILAVDDDPDVLKIVDKALKGSGHKIEFARDGREAEEKLAKGRYDLVLLDAMLPHVHGFELCSRLKANVRTRNMPVILMTAVYRGWRYAHDARSTFGADDYIEKPFHLPDLVKRVEAKLSGVPVPPSPDESEQLYQEGMGKLEAGLHAEARKVLEHAVRKDPLSARAQFALARAMEKEGDVFHAISAYERSVELRPNLFPALKALAALYERKGFRRKAVEALERAVHTAPNAETREALRKQLIQMI